MAPQLPMQCMTFYQMLSTYILLGPPGGNAVHNDIYLLILLLIFTHTHIITLCPKASLRARLHFLVGVPFHVLEGGPRLHFLAGMCFHVPKPLLHNLLLVAFQGCHQSLSDPLPPPSPAAGSSPNTLPSAH